MAMRRTTSSSRTQPFLVIGRYSAVQTTNSCTTQEKRFVFTSAFSSSFDPSDDGGISLHHLNIDKPSPIR